MSRHLWRPWYSRIWFRYPVSLCTYSNWAGSHHKFARDESGRIVKFWTEKGAQKYADQLNAANPEGVPEE